MEQAADTAHGYFHRAIKTIDDEFGHGYAKQHPELIAAFIRTAAADYQATLSAQSVQSIETSVEELANAIRDGARLVH
jgi:hypothetical protein